MSIQITFLGTAAMVPTKERNHSGIFLSYKNHGILFDCGEGIQRQFRCAEISLTKITKIVISHLHGDHVLGLAGLLQTLSAAQPGHCITLYGPQGIQKMMDLLIEAFPFDNKLELTIVELQKDGIFFEQSEYQLEAYALEHKVPTFGFRFVEKDRRRILMQKLNALGIPQGPHLGQLQDGKDITYRGTHVRAEEVTELVLGKIISYIADTLFCSGCLNVAKQSDVLICESTYCEHEREKADQYQHMTAAQAAQVAHGAEARMLILTHFSQRYKESEQIAQEATTLFPHTKLAYDLMTITV